MKTKSAKNVEISGDNGQQKEIIVEKLKKFYEKKKESQSF